MSWTPTSVKLVNYAPYFEALGIEDWDVGQHGPFWWARALDEARQEHIVMGHISSSAALEALLQQLSALV